MTTLTDPTLQPTIRGPSRRRGTRRRRRVLLVFLLFVVPVALLSWLTAGRGYKTRLFRALGVHARPAGALVKVAASVPDSGAVNVALSVRPTIHLRASDDIAPDTLSSATVRLVRTGDQQLVPAEVLLADRGAFEIRPRQPLEPLTNYTVLIVPGLRTRGGAVVQPYLTAFTTGGETDHTIRFVRSPLPAAEGIGATALTIGPDGKLYVGTDDGRILRFGIKSDGNLELEKTITTLPDHSGGPRLLIGLVFQPGCTADAPVAWVTHSFCALEDVPDFTGAVARLSGRDLEQIRDIVINLPRSTRDHATNQPAFGPDGALYIPQASNTAFGAPDSFWGMRPERLLSASILRLDLSGLPDHPIDARTPDAGGSYDPFAPGAPLTIYATGVRLAYELIWHSNGQLYAPTNGASLGGNAPAGNGAPPLDAIPLAEDDWLHRVAPGGYHGHPNPAQGHFVLNGGNPTAGHDYAETPIYPVGTRPDPKWVRPAYVFGQHVSANGVVEYKSEKFGGRLRGQLLVCRYSRGQDIIALKLNSAGDVVDSQIGIKGLGGFNNPLDLVEDPRTGNLYVSEYGGRKITLCRPVEAVR